MNVVHFWQLDVNKPEKRAQHETNEPLSLGLSLPTVLVQDSASGGIHPSLGMLKLCATHINKHGYHCLCASKLFMQRLE